MLVGMYGSDGNLVCVMDSMDSKEIAAGVKLDALTLVARAPEKFWIK